MKCISLLQPWASLVILGAKRYETRTWATAHRGGLAVHASKRFPEEARELCRKEPFRSLLKEGGYLSWLDLPTGAVLGAVELTGCLPAEAVPRLDRCQLALGDFRRGRWAWVLTNPRALPAPVPFRGMLGVFELPAGFVGDFTSPAL